MSIALIVGRRRAHARVIVDIAGTSALRARRRIHLVDARSSDTVKLSTAACRPHSLAEVDDGRLVLVVDDLHEGATLIAVPIASIEAAAVHLVLAHAQTIPAVNQSSINRLTWAFCTWASGTDGACGSVDWRDGRTAAARGSAPSSTTRRGSRRRSRVRRSAQR